MKKLNKQIALGLCGALLSVGAGYASGGVEVRVVGDKIELDFTDAYAFRPVVGILVGAQLNACGIGLDSNPCNDGTYTERPGTACIPIPFANRGWKVKGTGTDACVLTHTPFQVILTAEEAARANFSSIPAPIWCAFTNTGVAVKLANENAPLPTGAAIAQNPCAIDAPERNPGVGAPVYTVR